MSTDSSIKTVSIHGVPRSGTSWLGQIFNSHPEVAYRHQPLFSYRFKGRLTKSSKPCEIRAFLAELYETRDDDFINDVWEKGRGPVSGFRKVLSGDTMVMKMVRFHFLINQFLSAGMSIKVIGIVRHPCAVINSWLRAPREFSGDWVPLDEWRYAPSKNRGRIEEYNGYEKWKELSALFLELERSERDFQLVRYEDLVAAPEKTVSRLFQFCGLDFDAQVMEFIAQSQSIHDAGPYSVFKNPDELPDWRETLLPEIAEEILRDLSGSKLGELYA